MDALGAERAHIAGASIAQLVAINRPARAKSPSRSCPPPDGGTSRRATSDYLGSVSPPKSFSREDLIDASMLVQKTLASPGFRPSKAEMRSTAERRTDRAPFDAAGLARQSAALIAAPPRNALLQKLRCPTLVLHGADDPAIPAAAARDTAKSVPGAQLVIVPGMGHDFAAGLVRVHLKHIGDFVSKVEAETARAD